MISRKMLTTVGAAALGLGLLVGGAPAILTVSAQEATPAVEAPVQPDTEQEVDFDAERAVAYDAFVASMASELGSDEAAVDAAIRAALIQQIDDQFAAGEIDEERAAAAEAVIEVSDAPLFLGFGGRGGMQGFGDRHGGHDRNGDDDQDRSGDRGSRSNSDAPATLPDDSESN